MRKKTASVVNKYKVPKYDVYIGRGSKWGNPFTHLDSATKAEFKVATREESVEAFKEYIVNGDGQHLLADLDELRGKVLGCFCKPKACHGDVLLELLKIH